MVVARQSLRQTLETQVWLTGHLQSLGEVPQFSPRVLQQAPSLSMKPQSTQHEAVVSPSATQQDVSPQAGMPLQSWQQLVRFSPTLQKPSPQKATGQTPKWAVSGRMGV
jgi:hypothetical protein